MGAFSQLASEEILLQYSAATGLPLIRPTEAEGRSSIGESSSRPVVAPRIIPGRCEPEREERFICGQINDMPETAGAFRKQLLSGERLLYYPIDHKPPEKKSFCQGLSEVFKACFYRRKPPQEERPMIMLPRVRKDCC